MAENITPYIPDLEKISRHNESPEPLMLSDREYRKILSEYDLVRGANMSDVDILIAMELGLIKIWDKEYGFDLLKQVGPASIDLRCGHDYWWFARCQLSELTFGSHKETLENDPHSLGYAYQHTGELFTYYAHSDVVLFHTQEYISLSNCIEGEFEGRSGFARLGMSFHQTAPTIEPGFYSPIFAEGSNVNFLVNKVKTGETIGSLKFKLLAHPSSRPRNLNPNKNVQNSSGDQITPFNFWRSEWDPIRSKGKLVQARILISQGKDNEIIDNYRKKFDPKPENPEEDDFFVPLHVLSQTVANLI